MHNINNPTIEQFNSWTKENKHLFIQRNFRRLSGDIREEIITGIPRFLKTLDDVVIKYFYNDNKELLEATAMTLAEGSSELEKFLIGFDAIIENKN